MDVKTVKGSAREPLPHPFLSILLKITLFFKKIFKIFKPRLSLKNKD